MVAWLMTPHAGQQMEERGLTQEQVDAVLARPQVTAPDPKGEPNCRYYKGGGVLAVVNELSREVITVGYDGASSRDWESFSAPLAGPLPPEPQQLRSRRKRRKEDKGLPVAKSTVLDGVHPRVAADVRAYLARHGLDFRAVRVDSPTEVTINPTRTA